MFEVESLCVQGHLTFTDGKAAPATCKHGHKTDFSNIVDNTEVEASGSVLWYEWQTGPGTFKAPTNSRRYYYHHPSKTWKISGYR